MRRLLRACSPKPREAQLRKQDATKTESMVFTKQEFWKSETLSPSHLLGSQRAKNYRYKNTLKFNEFHCTE